MSSKQKQHIVAHTTKKTQKRTQSHKLPNPQKPSRQNQNRCRKGCKILKMFGASVHFPSSTPQPSLMCPGKGVALLRCAGVLWHISPCSCFSAYCYVPPTYVLSLNSRLPFSSLLFLLHPSTTCLSQSLSLSLYARLSGYFWFHSLLERLY